MSNSSGEQVLQELKRISRLLAINLIENKTTQSDKIEALNHYGFQNKEIADILGTNEDVVRATLSKIRKRMKTVKEK